MRTCYTGQVCRDHLGQTVTLFGWVHRRRDHGGVIFIDMRDRAGLAQIVFDPDNVEGFAIAERLRNEFCIRITGLVRERPAGTSNKDLASGEIEIAPIAFMRGRTLADSFIILDEAQNTTAAQMKMFLTRFGMNSRMVICGDPHQVDIPGGERMSGLNDAVQRLEGVDGIKTIRFNSSDVVRHPLVGRIVDAYEGGHD